MSRLTKSAYEKLIKEDLAWLMSQPRTLERDHIEALLKDSPNRLYPDTKWEYWCDTSYFDEWCVRQIGEKRWGYCFHVNSRQEAEGLCNLLNSMDKPSLLGRLFGIRK